MSKYEFEIKGKEYKVTVVEVLGDAAVVEVNGETYEVAVKRGMIAPAALPQAAARAPAAAPVPSAKAPKSAAPAGAGTVTCPMPGTVLKIMVNVGDQVSRGDTVMIVEAMKMENEIKIGSTGTVKKIHVNSGDNVAAGAPLLTVE